MNLRMAAMLAFATLGVWGVPIAAAADDAPCDRNHYILGGVDLKSTGIWQAAPRLGTPRSNHSATLLADGRVLVAGGGTSNPDGSAGGLLDTAEIFDPASLTWTPTGRMLDARLGHAAVRLGDGKVLVVGGVFDPMVFGSMRGSAELYDPASGSWSATGGLLLPRSDFTATLLQDGRVLVAGGVNNGDGAVNTTEIYDPASGAWTYGGLLQVPRFLHTATLLADGSVLLAGGWIDDFFQYTTSTAERYDPATNRSSRVSSLSVARVFHAAATLPNGKVLVSGGYRSDPPGGFGTYVPQSFSEAEIFDPATGTWDVAASLPQPRDHHVATSLPDGSVLVMGGSDAQSRTFQVDAERYDPVTDRWAFAGLPPTAAVEGFTSTVLPDGRVLIAGGSNYPSGEPVSVDTVAIYSTTSCGL